MSNGKTRVLANELSEEESLEFRLSLHAAALRGAS